LQNLFRIINKNYREKIFFEAFSYFLVLQIIWKDYLTILMLRMRFQKYIRKILKIQNVISIFMNLWIEYVSNFMQFKYYLCWSYILKVNHFDDSFSLCY
jgi:hypothetical protein